MNFLEYIKSLPEIDYNGICEIIPKLEKGQNLTFFRQRGYEVVIVWNGIIQTKKYKFIEDNEMLISEKLYQILNENFECDFGYIFGFDDVDEFYCKIDGITVAFPNSTNRDWLTEKAYEIDNKQRLIKLGY